MEPNPTEVILITMMHVKIAYDLSILCAPFSQTNENLDVPRFFSYILSLAKFNRLWNFARSSPMAPQYNGTLLEYTNLDIFFLEKADE